MQIWGFQFHYSPHSSTLPPPMKNSVTLLSQIRRPLNLEALKIWCWKPKNLEISVKIWRLTITYTFGGYAKKGPFFGVEHDKNTMRVSISSKPVILICLKMSRGRDSECERLVASDNLIWHRFSKYGFLCYRIA